ncbi:hypothetical protein PVAND_016527 [Polypedilum vanderplanki]|uniref:Uncharacterized protein n=1 Tax=Polypedilum vanderplanki TaxID=319348 RepID=A0A9J6BG67_POLVA|nr:hypothetical protein PVAND_016527 [Polypedilum vanderplanki]
MTIKQQISSTCKAQTSKLPRPLNINRIKSSLKKANNYKPQAAKNNANKKVVTAADSMKLKIELARSQMMQRSEKLHKIPKILSPIREVEEEEFKIIKVTMADIEKFYAVPKLLSPIKEIEEKTEKVKKEEKFDFSIYEIESSFLKENPRKRKRESLKLRFKKVDSDDNYKCAYIEELEERIIDGNLRQIIDNYAENIEAVVKEIQKEKRRKLK